MAIAELLSEAWGRLDATQTGEQPPTVKRMPSLAELWESEWCVEFVRLMRNRLVMGAFRYGTFAEHEARGFNGYDNVRSAIERLQEFQKTGNAEHLVDASNLCLKEFRVGDHPLRHWAPKDDGSHAKRGGNLPLEPSRK